MPQSERWLGSAAGQCSTLFLSTPSTRRATPEADVHQGGRAISTHALHEEGDGKCDGKTSILPLPFVH